MTIDLILAHDVSWRSVLGPRPWVRLEIYGPHAEATARALAMIPADPLPGWEGLWLITEHTPELAEAALQRAERGEPQRTTSAPTCRTGKACMPEATATASAARHRRDGKGRHAYRCEVCGWWHLAGQSWLSRAIKLGGKRRAG